MIRKRRYFDFKPIRHEILPQKLYFWITLISIFLLLLVFRLYILQCKNQSLYIDLSKKNHDRVLSIDCPRGTIFDRNGVKLAVDIPSYHINVNLQEAMNNLAGKSTSEKLKTLSTELSKTINMSSEKIYQVFLLNKENAEEFIIKSNLDTLEYARFIEKSYELPGFYIKEGYKRMYPKGSLLAHILGYTGLMSSSDLNNPEFSRFDQNERIGKVGIERYYEKILHGSKGTKIQTINALGNVIDEKDQTDVIKGDNINLTIDATLQAYVEETIKEHLGSMIVINCNNGEILACASNPTFDLNLYSKSFTQKEYDAYESRGAFFNRSIQGKYPPGSTFKPLLSLYAIENDIITHDTELFCGGSIKVPGLENKYRCWVFPSQHGWLKLKLALKYSCDVFFYELARKCKIQDLLDFIAKFVSLGQQTGVDVPFEESGFLGSPTWKQKFVGYNWFEGDSMNLGIGQGYIMVTPIQMAKLYAQLANGGKRIIPHFLQKTGKNKVFFDFLSTEQNKYLKETFKVSPSNILSIQQDLHAVVEGGGTAPMLYDSAIKISAKTGTAEGSPDSTGKITQHLWISAFAPTDNPEIAVIILFENSKLEFGGNLAPFVKKVFLKYFELSSTYGGQNAN